jgi:cytochrome o ubiquinol oxidase subunit 2
MTLGRRILLMGLFGLSLVLLFSALIGTRPVALFAPAGTVATHERDVILLSFGTMLVMAIPMLVLLYLVAWRYRESNTKVSYKPKSVAKVRGELVLWALPTVIVLILWGVTWKSSHALDPFTPIASDRKPVAIQVVALPWKWLFIYPDQGIATVNQITIPAHTPVHFDLTADGPMSSFWIPQLGSQMYAMAAMHTQLNLMATTEGIYPGRNTEINGEGYAGMTFNATVVSPEAFEAWAAEAKRSAEVLDDESYRVLAAPSADHPPVIYSSVEPGLFATAMMKDMMPTSTQADHEVPGLPVQDMDQMDINNMHGMPGI